ncbi:MAG: Spy/CpxP family protein refolding chaperone [Aestuariivirga sp.]|nr:Spy/CpxP family protein refolding chaperone [Aestuariivirga sp.]
MLKSKSLITLTLAAMLAASSQGFAQTQPEHHLTPDTHSAEAAPGNQDQQGVSTPMMMDMMAGMMKMMGGGGAQMSMGGMGMTDHTAGRIAFLRAELQITDAQSKIWDAFADTMQKIGSQMKEAGMPMMAEALAPQLLARLDSQERMLTARLEGVRAMKAAFGPLYDALSAEQRKTADDLLANHMGLMPLGMMQGGMMQGGMMPAQ